jgi:hypothetical protein
MIGVNILSLHWHCVDEREHAASRAVHHADHGRRAPVVASAASPQSNSLASCPARNRVICLNDPHAANGIRFVRARVCDPAASASCDRVTYKPLLPFTPLPIKLTRASTIATVDSLGFTPGQNPCP